MLVLGAALLLVAGLGWCMDAQWNLAAVGEAQSRLQSTARPQAGGLGSAATSLTRLTGTGILMAGMEWLSGESARQKAEVEGERLEKVSGWYRAQMTAGAALATLGAVLLLYGFIQPGPPWWASLIVWLPTLVTAGLAAAVLAVWVRVALVSSLAAPMEDNASAAEQSAAAWPVLPPQAARTGPPPAALAQRPTPVLVLETFYARISQRNYLAAYDLLSSVMKRGLSPEQFGAEWAAVQRVSVTRPTWDHRLEAMGGLRQFDVRACLVTAFTSGAQSSTFATVAMLWDGDRWLVGPTAVPGGGAC
jgi:hypothetical protein